MASGLVFCFGSSITLSTSAFASSTFLRMKAVCTFFKSCADTIWIVPAKRANNKNCFIVRGFVIDFQWLYRYCLLFYSQVFLLFLLPVRLLFLQVKLQFLHPVLQSAKSLLSHHLHP